MWKNNNPEKAKEMQKKANKKWSAANPEKSKEIARNNWNNYYKTHREEILARCRNRYKQKKEEICLPQAP